MPLKGFVTRFRSTNQVGRFDSWRLKNLPDLHAATRFDPWIVLLVPDFAKSDC